jgi:hypothetical protein
MNGYSTPSLMSAVVIIPNGDGFANVLLNDWNFDFLVQLLQLFDLPKTDSFAFENLCTTIP